MSIVDEINRINGNIANAYNACNAKGATMPATQNSGSLAAAIDTIATGGGGDSSLFARYEIIRYENGVNVARAINASGEDFFKNIANVEGFSGWVNVPGGFEGAFRNCYGLRGSINFCSFNPYYGAGERAFASAFENCYNATGEVNFCQMTRTSNYSFQNAFRNCNRITGANFAGLQQVWGKSAFANAFASCSNLSYVKLGSPFYIGGAASFSSEGKFAYAFTNCQKLVTVDIYVNDIASDYAFYQAFNTCGMNSVTFNVSSMQANYALQQCFRNCAYLRSLYFPNLSSIYTNSLNNMLYMCNDVTVHFKNNRESQWNTLDDFVNGFGGTNTTILFDL